MKRALVALIAGTVFCGLAAAYAATMPTSKDTAPIKAELVESSKLASN